MMVFLGGVVGGFLIAMYLPIFSIAGADQVAPSRRARTRSRSSELRLKLVWLTVFRTSRPPLLLAVVAVRLLSRPAPRSCRREDSLSLRADRRRLRR